MIGRIRRWLFPSRCKHDWRNTGAFYTHEYGTIVLKQCRLCGETLILEV